MEDDIGLLSSSSSVTSVTCSNSSHTKSHHQSVGSAIPATNTSTSTTGQHKRLNSSSFMRRSSSPPFISSLSRCDNENSTNRTSINNDSVSSSNSSVFIEEPAKSINKSLKQTSTDVCFNEVSASNLRHRTSYSDDYDTEFNSICNLSKLKLKQEETSFLNLIHECQVWIETISGSKFAFPNDFRKSLENGVLLCELIIVLKKGCIRRINRHSTPIAGIDNLNVFLRTCQDHFHLNQADLFDITDLEDLSRRRGDDLVSTTHNFYNPDDSKDSSDCNPNLNDYLTDAEQRRRLKKVINTINWLSRKAVELSIPVPYHFDTNNPSHHSKPSDLHIHHRNHNHHHNSSNSNHHQHKTTLGYSYNSVSSSTSSTSSSSSYCSSFSNSSLNQYSTSSSLSSSSSLSVIVPTSTTNPALLPPQIPHTKVSTPKPANASSLCSNSGNNQHHLLAKKRYSTNTALINTKPLDDIESHQHLNASDDTKATNNSLNQIKQNYTMSYIYKTQQSNLNGGKLANSLVTKRSASLQIDPSNSSNHSSSSSTSSDNNNALPAESLNRKDSVETIDSMSNSSTNSSLLNKNSSASSLGNGNHIKPLNHNLGDSQEDLQLIDSTMSPISSTNSAAVSPHLTISTSSSSNNISNSNTNLNSTNINNTLNHSQQQATSNTTVIPTRYIDRRVSNTPVEQKFNINYSKAGQELARKAAEQLKRVEKSKEVQKKVNSTAGFLNQSGPVNQKGPSLLQAALAYNKKPVESGRPKASGSGGGSANDDWQNSVDDWKNRRRAKKNLPPPRTGEELDFDDNEHHARSERRRINRFESSVHYLTPPDEDTKTRPTIAEQQQQPGTVSIEQTTNTIHESPKTSPIKDPSKVVNKSEPISNNDSSKKDTDNMNGSLSNEDNEEESMICTDFKYMFNEKFVEIDRPFDHPKRGFGFLLNSGLANKTHNCLKKLKDQSIDEILEQNYAQIMIVENESLADQSGIQKGDLVTHINKVGTANLSNEQLRKIMKERLQQNFVQLNLLQLEQTDEPNPNKETTTIQASEVKNNEKPDLNINEETKTLLNTKPVAEPTTTEESDQLNVQKTIDNNKKQLLKPVTSSSQLQQQQKVDYQHIVAPKPYKKTVSPATLPNPTPIPTTITTTANTLPNQLPQADEDMTISTDSLIEKQKSHLNLILNWAKSQNDTASNSISATKGPVDELQHLFCVADEPTTVSDLIDNTLEQCSPQCLNSLSESSSYCELQRPNDYETCSFFDSLIENANITNDTNLSFEEFNHIDKLKEKSSNPVIQTNESVKLETLENDDTDHDNDENEAMVEEEVNQSKMPPPVPATAPPPLPKSKISIELEDDIIAPVKEQKTSEIKKVFLDNLKSIESWKSEQEVMMKKKYEEGQKKIEISLKTDLEKVREEENQRREQERLKLEKERIRLHELELKQKEEELLLKQSTEKKTADKKSGHEDESTATETVRKEDLNALIQKIYTEESNELDELTDLNQPETTFQSSNDFAECQQTFNSSTYLSTNSKSNGSQSMKRTSIVMTKTSPIVAAALSQAEEEDFDTVDKKITEDNSQKKLMLKQVHESMDSLKSQLLQKGVTEAPPKKKTSPQSTGDYVIEKQNQEEKRAELLKREQEAIKLEKQKIEEEKERLRLEAEQLRIERELIYMATKAKSSACQIAATSGTTSSSTSSTCSANDQLDTEYSTSNMTPTDPADQYKVLNQFSCQGNRASSPKSIPIIFPSNYNENKYSKLRDYQNIEPQQSTLPQQWLIEEAERQRNAKLANTNSIHIASAEQKQKHRRSVPNMNQIMDQGNNYQNMQYNTNYQNIGYVNQLIPSNTAPAVSRIYEKQRGSKSSTASRSQQQQPKYQPRHANIQLTPNPYMAKPPTSRSQISTSQTDLKHKKNQSSKSSQQQQQNLSNSTSTLSGSKGGPPVISLNQKCSCCAQMLGQGSAMFIEKLGLAFHLKCFRCSVCNVPLGNGKEGTDVRVSVTNRLHCNNCFSNDLGVRLSAV